MVNETWLLGWTDKLKMFIDLLSPDQKDQLLEILLQENKEKKKNYWEPIPELVWNFDKVLEFINDKCVKSQEIYLVWKWFMYTIELPAVWEFEWFKFKCFKSEWVNNFDGYNKDLNGSSMWYSMEEIWEILQKINEFLMAYWVWNGNINDFSEELKSWARGTDNINGDLCHFSAWTVLCNILGKGSYRLSGKVPAMFGLYGGVVLLLNDEWCDFRYSTQYDFNKAYEIFKM